MRIGVPHGGGRSAPRLVVRLAWTAGLTLAAALAGCSAQPAKPLASSSLSLAAVEPAEALIVPKAPVPTSAPAVSVSSARQPVVSGLGDLAIERGKAVEKVGKPYKVAGLWYVPKHQPDYDETGIASWYGPNFHGKYTANGEIYNQTRLTAAHPTLPLPSYVEVTNRANGRTIVVRVNDRGPYKRGRILDLSARAAKLLGYESNGTAEVRVRYVGRAPLAGDDRYERDFLAKQAWFSGAPTAEATEVAEVDFTASIDLGDPAPPVAQDAMPAVIVPAPSLEASVMASVFPVAAPAKERKVASSK